jgi:hypothetical protein
LIPKRQLHDARVGRGLDLSESVIDQGGDRLAEVGVVKSVEKLGTELQSSEALTDAEALDHRDIGIQ